MRRPLAALLMAALSATASGCSFVAVRRPGPLPEDAPLECTESRAAPIADTVGAVLTPFVGLVAWTVCIATVSAAAEAAPGESDCAALAWAALAGTAAYTGSAVYGYRSTGECRRIAAERRARAPGAASRAEDDAKGTAPGGLRQASLCLDTPPRAPHPAAGSLAGSGASR